MAAARRYTKELLEPLVAEATSVAGVLRMLGLRQNGGSHAHLSRIIKRYELDTSHFRRYVPRAVPQRLAPEQILVQLAANHRRQKPRLLKRALIEIGRPYVCVACGNDGTWLGQPLSLEIDHINGDFLDNRPENLRFLCPNCHRQTPNFAGRSKGRFTGPNQAAERAL